MTEEKGLRYNKGKPKLSYILTIHPDVLHLLNEFFFAIEQPTHFTLRENISQTLAAWHDVKMAFIEGGMVCHTTLYAALINSVRLTESECYLSPPTNAKILHVFGLKSFILIANIFEKGAEKYPAHNWLKGLDEIELLDSAKRHLQHFCGGESTDPETGLPHLGHMLWNHIVFAHFQAVRKYTIQ